MEHIAADVVCPDSIIDASESEGKAKLNLSVICYLQPTACAIHGSDCFSVFHSLYVSGVLYGKRESLLFVKVILY